YESFGNTLARFTNKDGSRKYSDANIDMMVYAASKINNYQNRLRDLTTEVKGINILQFQDLLDTAADWAKSPNTAREAEMYLKYNSALEEIDKQDIPDVD